MKGYRGFIFYNIKDFSLQEVNKFLKLLNNRYMVYLMQVFVLTFEVKFIYKVVNRLKKKAVNEVKTPPLLKRYYIGCLKEQQEACKAVI